MKAQNDELIRLKHLLLQDEHHTLERLENIVEQHQSRIGNADALRRSVSEIVTDALRDAERKEHRDLETAISPLVVGSIRRELRNSQDEMVEAFYPILGRLVSTYVATRFRQFVEALDDRIGNGFSGRFLLLRLKSWWSGVPYKALLLREAGSPTIIEVSVIQRRSGILIDHWRACDEDVGDAEDTNETLFGGLVAAINEFANNALQADDNHLRSFETLDSRVYLRASSSHILAVRIRGRINAAMERALDKTLLEIVEHQVLEHRDRGLESVAQQRISSRLPEAAEQLSDTVLSQRRTPIFGLAALTLVFLLGAGVAGWYYIEWSREAAAEQQVYEIVAQQPALSGFPIEIEVSGDRMLVSGLVPSTGAKREFEEAVTRVSGARDVEWQITSIGDEPVVERLAELEDLVARLATQESMQALDTRLRSDLELIKGQFATLQTETMKLADQQSVDALEARVATLLHDLNRLEIRISAEIAQMEENSRKFAMSQDLSLLSERLQALNNQINTPNAHLMSWIQSNAIFFSLNVDFRDPDVAEKQLSELAGLIKKTDRRLRIVGFTDPSGSDERNKLISAARAIKVEDALIARGVPEDRLKAIGRSEADLLSADVGRTSSNRRVEFELLYTGEPATLSGDPTSDRLGQDTGDP